MLAVGREHRVVALLAGEAERDPAQRRRLRDRGGLRPGPRVGAELPEHQDRRGRIAIERLAGALQQLALGGVERIALALLGERAGGSRGIALLDHAADRQHADQREHERADKPDRNGGAVLADESPQPRERAVVVRTDEVAGDEPAEIGGEGARVAVALARIERHRLHDDRLEVGRDLVGHPLPVGRSIVADEVDHLRRAAFAVRQLAVPLAAQIKLAEMAFKRNKVDAAEATVSEILRKDSRNENALKVRASIRIVRGQLDLAIIDLQQALKDQPRSTELISLLALAYERNGSMMLADRQYTDAIRISNFDLNVGLNYVNFLLRRGNVDRAEQFLTELSKRSPRNLDVLSALARVELGRGEWAGAQAVAESIRSIDLGRSIADQVLGTALLGQRKYEESIAVFQSAVNASPSAVQPMISLVHALVRAQKTDKAMAFLRSILDAHPDNAEAQVLMGSIQLATGSRDHALESFKTAVEKQPTNIVGYQALANFYGSEKKFDNALTVIRSGLQMQPDNIALHLAMADALEQTHEYEAAISEYEHILSKQPGSMIAANNLASLLSNHRTDKASLERAQTLVAALKETQTPQFKDTIGWISYRRDDYVNAVPLLEKAVAALPHIALVHYHLAMSYIAIRQTAKASEELRMALSLAPDSDLEAKIQDALRNLQNM